ncbi:MAG: DUF4129 domain-containing protein [Planctomycetaceae bacterium]|nr:DUF4129 domain-containing protein [Planctomycetaceae bacterium]
MAAPPPESIRETTEQVLSSGDYLLDAEENPLAPFWERMWDLLLSVLELIRGFFWFLHGLPFAIQWIIIAGLFTLLIVLTIHILYTMIRAMGREPSPARFSGYRPEHRDDPRVWEEQATQLASVGSFIEAVRLLLRASLFRLEESFERPFRRSTTNREYLRKYRKLPVINEVKLLVETVDRKWYGEEICLREDYEQCREAHATIVEMIKLHAPRQREAS